MLPFAGVVTDAVTGAVLSSVKVMAVPLKVLPTLSVAFACTVYVPSPSDAHVGNVALLVQSKLRIHGQTEDLPCDFFRDREIAFLIP